jgi:tetratricopeptide (TPR) repeat protein
LIHEYLDDVPGTRALDDRALAIRERLVEEKRLVMQEELWDVEGRMDLEKDLAGTYQTKAIALAALGDLAGAVGLFDRALAIYERLVEREGRRELAKHLAATYQNKARALTAFGDLVGADGLYDRALAIRERLVEEKRLVMQEERWDVDEWMDLESDLARVYQNKAIMLEALGDLAGAVGFYDRALAFYERFFDIAKTGDFSNCIRKADTFRTQWDFDGALEEYLGAVGLRDSILTHDERQFERYEFEGQWYLANEFARIYHDKAVTLTKLGDIARAVGFFDRALTIYEGLVVEEERWHLADALAKAYHNKADALKALGDLGGAFRFYDRALPIYERLIEQEGRWELRGDLAQVQAAKADAPADVLL